jgi:hypothetical protein
MAAWSVVSRPEKGSIPSPLTMDHNVIHRLTSKNLDYRRAALRETSGWLLVSRFAILDAVSRGGE